MKLENSLSDHLSNISHIATEISSKIIVSHCTCFILVILVLLAVKLNPSYTPPHPKQITCTFVDILVSSAVKWTATCWHLLSLILSDYGCEIDLVLSSFLPNLLPCLIVILHVWSVEKINSSRQPLHKAQPSQLIPWVKMNSSPWYGCHLVLLLWLGSEIGK